MSDFDAVGYLASKGVRGRPMSGGREMAYPCFFTCEEPSHSAKKKLYVNVADSSYHCFVCGSQGGSYTLQKHFGDEPRAGTTDDAFLRRRLLDAAAEAGISILHNNDDPLLWLLNERGLTAETIEARKLGFIAGGWSLAESIPGDHTKAQIASTGLVWREGPRAGRDFFYRHVLIPYISRGHVIQMRGRAWGESKGGKYLTGQGDPPRIYNSDSLDGADDVIITEGEFDTMILSQALSAGDERARRIGVISVPGTNAIPDELLDLLTDVKRVYIGFDSDDPGRRAAEALKEKIGSRARVLTLPYEDGRKCDWTEYLLPAGDKHWANQHPYAGHSYRDVLRLLSTASGKRVHSMAESQEAYLAYRELHDGLLTGYAALDAIIRPGLLPGQVMVVLAKTGSGKTIFLCNLAFNMRAARVLFISLEMTREEVWDRMRRIYLFHHPDHTEADAVREMSNIYICDENRLGEKDIASLVGEFEVEAGFKPDAVFVDYLGYYARGARGMSPYEKTSNAVMQLKADAKAGRYVVISPSQVNRGAKEGKPIDLDDARDAGSVEETADFLFALYRPDDALANESVVNNQPQSGVVKMSALKSRHGGKGKVLSLRMDLLTLALVEDNTPAAQRAADHNQLAWRGHTWDDMRRAETRPRQLKIRSMP